DATTSTGEKKLKKKREKKVSGAADATGAAACTTTGQDGDNTKILKKLVSESQYPALLTMIEGSLFNIEDMIDEALLLEEMRTSPPSKKQLHRTIMKVAKKEKRCGDLKRRWYVDDS